MSEPEADPVDEALRERDFLLAACPPDLLGELAVHVDREGWTMLMAALAGEGPTAYELAEHARRRAAVWTRLAEIYPDRFGQAAALAREDRRAADARHTAAAVINHALLSEPER